MGNKFHSSPSHSIVSEHLVIPIPGAGISDGAGARDFKNFGGMNVAMNSTIIPDSGTVYAYGMRGVQRSMHSQRSICCCPSWGGGL